MTSSRTRFLAHPNQQHSFDEYKRGEGLSSPEVEEAYRKHSEGVVPYYLSSFVLMRYDKYVLYQLLMLIYSSNKSKS